MTDRYRQIVVDNKQMEQRLKEETAEGKRIKGELKNATRTGKQPSLAGESKEQKKKRFDKLSGIS